MAFIHVLCVLKAVDATLTDLVESFNLEIFGMSLHGFIACFLCSNG